MKIALIGAGNVAWHLAQALHAAGHTITAVYSRTASHREALAGKVPPAQALPSLDLRKVAADVVLVAVPDAALAAVAAALQVQAGTVVAHTSGSQPLAILARANGAAPGVFYPLQTFSKSKAVDLAQVPVLVEAQGEDVLRVLQALAQSISKRVTVVDSEARKQLHLAAVFACNFTNHLLGISRQLLEEANLPTALLQPLLHETIAKAAQQHPFAVQTGPAIRHDDNVIQAHLHMLQPRERWQEVYRALTQSIQETGSPS